MDLADRLKSFPVIAALALLVALLIGLLFGMGGPSPARVAELGLEDSCGEPDRDARRDRGSRGSDAYPDPGVGVNGRDLGPDPDPDPPDRNGGGSRGTTARPRVMQPRKLKPGRVDPISIYEGAVAAEGSISVTVKYGNGNVLRYPKLSLEVAAGSLGWQTVRVAAGRQPAGERVFTGLFPGEYRVTSLLLGYTRASETVMLSAGEPVRYVELLIQVMANTRVEFYLTREDGGYPDQVSIQRRTVHSDDYISKGRFGTHKGPRVVSSVAVSSVSSRRDLPAGMVEATVRVGEKTRFIFTEKTDDAFYRGEVTFVGEPGLNRYDVELVKTEHDPRATGRALRNAWLEVSLEMADGSKPEFSRVAVRPNLETLIGARGPTVTVGAVFTWKNLSVGTWFIVAESEKFHAAFVQEVEVEGPTKKSYSIAVGRLRVSSVLDPASPASEGELSYKVRLWPRAAGTIESTFMGRLKEKDHIDFIIPVGEYRVIVEPRAKEDAFSVTPSAQSLTVAAGEQEELTFKVAAAATLTFRCVDGAGAPIPNPEFLVTLHPAGSVPESEKANMVKGATDGTCRIDAAPHGAVYLMIWTDSSDWGNPDKVFQIELPAFGSKDLGSVVISP